MNFSTKFKFKFELLPILLQWFLNLSLILLSFVLLIFLSREVYHLFFGLFWKELDLHTLLESILVFFLYFEFIAMIVKYFKENYHFPLRYFLYIGITAMIRLIIVDHENPTATLLYSFVILTLIIGYYIVNKTPRSRP